MPPEARFMYEKLTTKASILNETVDWLGKEICLRLELEEPAHLKKLHSVSDFSSRNCYYIIAQHIFSPPNSGLFLLFSKKSSILLLLVFSVVTACIFVLTFRRHLESVKIWIILVLIL